MKNWWYYHKWYVICGIILLGILINLVGSAFGIWTKAPDFQVAYVGKSPLPQDSVSALEKAFASISKDLDFNEDGEVIVQINQYTNGSENEDAEAAYYEYASELTLIGDISDCESYFFLMDDPNHFQRNFQLLACPDGSCPDETDYSTEDKVILWSECPILSSAELGTYSSVILGDTVTGTNQELLSNLYLGRRCFYTEKQTKHSKNCSMLWDLLVKE